MQCANAGGKLLTADNPFSLFDKLKTSKTFIKKSFFIGGSSLFDNVLSLSEKYDTESSLVWHLSKGLALQYGISHNDMSLVFRRFSGHASSEELQVETPMAGMCLSLNFLDDKGLEFVDCEKKIAYICQKVEDLEHDPNAVWSPWISVGKAKFGDVESLGVIVNSYNKRTLDVASLRLCQKPVAIQCRDVNSKQLYSKQNPHGLKLQVACENNMIRCVDKHQKGGPACPDFEVRFQCIAAHELSCYNPMVVNHCLAIKRGCQDKIYGPQCLGKPTARPLPEGNSGGAGASFGPTPASCKAPFTLQEGLCLLVQKGQARSYFDAAMSCANLGGKLLTTDKPFSLFDRLRTSQVFLKKSFFIGGSSLFDNILDLSESQATEDARAWHMAKILALRLNIDHTAMLQAFRRFSGHASNEDLQAMTSVTNMCLSFNFVDNKGPEFVDCEKKIPCICQKVDDLEHDPNAVWSPWISVGKAKFGDVESLGVVVNSYNKGILKVPSLRLCQKPVAIQCRDVNSKQLYSKQNPHGLKLQVACENNMIRCVDKHQKGGPACPDFEVRFQCMAPYELRCSNPMVLNHCRTIKRGCQDKVYGPQCLGKPTAIHLPGGLSGGTGVKPVTCKKPFKLYEGLCLFAQRAAARSYFDAATRCATLGGKMLTTGSPLSLFNRLKTLRVFIKKSFFFGGSSLFDNVLDLSESQDAESTGLWHLAKGLADQLKVSHGDMVKAFRRFSGHASDEDLKIATPTSKMCLSFNFFNNKGVEFVDCEKRIPFICEKVTDFAEDHSVTWSPWINVGKAGYGDVESLGVTVNTYNKGTLKIPGLRLCQKPVAMECRDVSTKKLYSKDNPNGLKLNIACVNNAIKCMDKQQRGGPACPDFEVRFQCIVAHEIKCFNPMVKSHCEKQNRKCQDKVYGPQCVAVRPVKTGKEVIGTGTCTQDGVKYDMHQCAARGDPHYITLDSLKYDFQGKCSYTLVQICNSFTKSDRFPTFRIISSNDRRRPSDQVSFTRGFELSVRGIRYTFRRGTFKVNGMKRNSLDFKDGNIKITTENKGRTPKLTIDTDFCLQISWDNRMNLYVKVPSVYKNHTCGLCGNYDGNKKNEFVIPGDDRPRKGAFLKYYMAPDDSGNVKCNDKLEPTRDCSMPDRTKYKGSAYCGVFDPEGKSPFARVVLSTSDPSVVALNKERLNTMLEECVLDHCWETKFEFGRCFEMETSIEQIFQDLDIVDKRELDFEWRAYAGCEKSEEVQCADKPHTHYESNYLIKCQPTCSTAENPEPCSEFETGSGCVCDEGFFLNTELQCVPPEECKKQCTVEMEDGETLVLKEQEMLVVKPCAMMVKCVGGQVVEQVLPGCSEHAKCSLDGTRCVCRQGYAGDGKTCERVLACREGYTRYGNLCYRYVVSYVDWYSAGITCSYDAAQLARYDTQQNAQLGTFIQQSVCQQQGCTGVWVGGNTLEPRLNVSSQVDPPRMVNVGQRGCFQARINSNKQMTIAPNPNCMILQPFICEYDINIKLDYDPNNIVGIPEMVDQQTAVAKCAERHRPLLRIVTQSQLDKAKRILVNQLRGNGWLDAKYFAYAQAFRWSDNSMLAFHSWTQAPMGGAQKSCLAMAGQNGEWFADRCRALYYPLCGPPECSCYEEEEFVEHNERFEQ